MPSEDWRDKFKEIRAANLPDAQTVIHAEVNFSFVQMLENYAQQVMTGKLSQKQFYQAMDNMQNAIEFFRNITMVSGER